MLLLIGNLGARSASQLRAAVDKDKSSRCPIIGDVKMRCLNEDEVTDVAGGIIPALVLLGFVAYNAGKIEDAVNGFFDALSEAK